MKKFTIVTTLALIMTLGLTGMSVSEESTVLNAKNVIYSEKSSIETPIENITAVSEFDKKMNDMLDRREKLSELYDKESDYMNCLQIADKMLDIDCSKQWYGVLTAERFWAKDTYEEKGLNEWVDGSIAYDSFTGEFMDINTPVAKITSNNFIK